MNQEQIDDLKQFIATTVSQATAELATRDELTAVEQRLTAKIDQTHEYIGEALDQGNEVHDAQLKDHEHRLRKLEHRAA